LPGYALAFHEETKVGRPRFSIAKRAKSSTVYKLVDRAAVKALMHTPDSILIGDPAAVVYTAHGFGGYYTLDGKPTVVATDESRSRYPAGTDAPWEDTSITTFVDERVPDKVTIELYLPAANTLTFYWNLDLDEYTPRGQRAAHELGTVTATSAGWQTVTFAVPRALIRTGVNKLGFRAAKLPSIALCAPSTPESSCLTLPAKSPPVSVMRVTGDEDGIWNVSALLHRVSFSFPGK
jgi:hypothetical protein